MALLLQRELSLKATLLLLKSDCNFVALAIQEHLKLRDVLKLLLELIELALVVLFVLGEELSLPIVVLIVLPKFGLLPGQLIF